MGKTIEIRKRFEIEMLDDSEYDLVKFHEESRYILGKVYEPNKVDSQGDYATAEEIELAAWQFMLNGGEINLMHKNRTVKAHVVENYIQRESINMKNRAGDMTHVPKGTWMLGVLLDESEKDIWEAIKRGEYKGFSMEGKAEAVGV